MNKMLKCRKINDVAWQWEISGFRGGIWGALKRDLITRIHMVNEMCYSTQGGFKRKIRISEWINKIILRYRH